MIKFRLVKIETQQFAALPDGLPPENKVDLQTKAEFYADKAHRTVVVAPHFSFLSGRKPFLIIQVALFAEIDPEEWAEQIDDNDEQLIVPKELARFLLGIAIGATRGVLHEKTLGTPHNKFILPTIDLIALVEGDMALALRDEEE